MTTLTGVGSVEVRALRGDNLDTVCYRGSAPLAHLALLSQADIFDQEANAEGLQRDLSPKHASDAYEYVHRAKQPEYPRAFPEIVLNVRDRRILKMDPLDSNGLVGLRFDIANMKDDKVYVSRVDGNHRLAHAAGDDRREPLLDNAPFQIHVGLTREQERSLFVDINSNQKGMNTSHLAMMQNRLTNEEFEIKHHLDRWIATKLVNDSASPWHGMIHLGGSKKGSRTQGLSRALNFASIQGGVKKLLQKSQYMSDLTNPQAQYVVVRNYWQAVKQVFAEEWASPRDFLLLKNIGVWSLSYLGGSIIDRCIPQSKYTVPDFAHYLRQAQGRFDWHSNAPQGVGSVAGMSGNKAALIVAGELGAELSDNVGLSISDLEKELLKDA